MEFNVQTVSTKEMRKFIGWRNFLNPFRTIQESVMRVGKSSTSSWHKKNSMDCFLWSASHKKGKHYNVGSLLYLTAFSICCSETIAFLFLPSNVMGIPQGTVFASYLLLGLFTAIVSVFLFVPLMVLREIKTLEKDPLMSVCVRQTGNNVIDAISCKNAFTVIQTLKYAGFSDDDIRQLDATGKELEEASNYLNDYKNRLKMTKMNSGKFTGIPSEIPRFELSERSRDLIDRAAAVLNINCRQQSIPNISGISELSNLLPDNSIFSSLLSAGISVQQENI